MGPMRQSVNEAPDWGAELTALCARYRLDRYRQPPGSPTPVAVTWMTDDGPHIEARQTARELVLYLQAKFRRP